MATRWFELRAALDSTLRRPSALALFQELRKQIAPVAGFDRPLDVVDLLHRSDGDLDDKDELYATLTVAARTHGPVGRMAATMIWLGLFPALTHLVLRLQAETTTAGDDALSLVSWALAESVARIDLERSTRVAATLLRNTERRCRQQLRPPVVVFPWATPATVTRRDTRLPVVGLGLGDDIDDLVLLRAWLLDRVGRDADLIVAMAVVGQAPPELARQLGIPSMTVRKRLSRALRHLRRDLKIIEKRLSHFGLGPRVLQVRDGASGAQARSDSASRELPPPHDKSRKT